MLPPSLLALPLLGDLLSHTVAPLLSRPMLPALLRRIFAPGRSPRVSAPAFPPNWCCGPAPCAPVAATPR
ncbi:hypothetical protein ACFQU7_17725 [Pseudoroseomonas wenyumeiae]